MAAPGSERFQSGFSGAVLAGGSSRRMGTDKARLRIDQQGTLLVQVAAQALQGASATEVFVVGNGSDGQAGPTFQAAGLRVIPDRYPGQGPLGGLISALHAATQDVVVALACDHTNAHPEAVSHLLDKLGPHDVVVAVAEGRLQVMHAVWHKSTLGVLEQAFDGGERRLRGPLPQLNVAYVDDADPSWFRSANTPEEFTARFGADAPDAAVTDENGSSTS